MNRSLYLLFFLTVPGFCQVIPTKQIPFSLGVDYSKSCSEIDIRGACDSSNLVPNQENSVTVRNGSERYINQAFSSKPFSSIYYYNVTTGATTRTGILGINGSYIVHSTDHANPQWVRISTSLQKENQQFEFIANGKDIIFTGDGLSDPIYKFDVMSSSLTTLFTSTNSALMDLRAKHIAIQRNHLILGNVLDVKDRVTGATTHYASRWYYSKALEISSVNVNNFEDVGIENGEIKKFSRKLGKLEIYQSKRITEVVFTDLRIGGDQDPVPIVEGFGLIASNTLQDVGIFDIGLSYEGIFAWDGSRRTRLEISNEKDLISKKIRSIIQELIDKGLYEKAVGEFYPKKNWYIFCYEQDGKLPKGVNNSCIAFDLNISEWFPLKNWLASDMTVEQGSESSGDLFYADSKDGYIHKIDVIGSLGDSRKEIWIDSADSTFSWVNSSTDTINIVEGTGSVRLVLSPSVLTSSITKIMKMNFDQWYDGTDITRKDKLQFKVFPSSVHNITAFRVDLLVEDSEIAFTLNFSSVIMSSGIFVSGESKWSTVEIDLSSFDVANSWIDLSSETIPYSKSLTYYGIRFVSTATGHASLTFDDLRVVQSAENPLNPFWLTAHFSNNTVSKKDVKQLILVSDQYSNSVLKVGVIEDFGGITRIKSSSDGFKNEIVVLNLANQGGVFVLDSNSLSVIRSSVQNNSVIDYMSGAFDGKFLYLADNANYTIVKIDITSLTVVVSSYGSLGSSTTSYDFIHQIAHDKNFLYVVDNGNSRLKKIDKNNLRVRSVFGTLGINTTSFHNPTGITSDELYIWIAEDGESRIKKLSKVGFEVLDIISMNSNTASEFTLQNDKDYLYIAYNKVHESIAYYQDIILEKRSKVDGSLIRREIIRPQNVVANSTRNVVGDICLLGDSLFITFDEESGSGSRTSYIQKRLKNDFSIVKEVSNANTNFGLIGNNLEFLSTRKTRQIDLNADDCVFIQLRYFSEPGTLGNKFTLISQGFALIEKPFTQ